MKINFFSDIQSLCFSTTVMVENEVKPFMVSRLIHTSYKGLISIYSYDTHKAGITFKLMLSSCRFTFIFGNPRLLACLCLIYCH